MTFPKRVLMTIVTLAVGSLGLWQCGGDGSGGGTDLGGGGPLKWYNTCGDPVCQGYKPPAGVPLCTAAMTAGASCATTGERCDPMNSCNQLLVCATSDPRMAPGGCPISRRSYKTNIQYLDQQMLQKYAQEIGKLRLATYRYKSGCPTRLGFIIEDQEPSMSIDAERDMVDLYGYTSMAVAALKVQQEQIAALQQQIGELQRQLAATRRARK